MKIVSAGWAEGSSFVGSKSSISLYISIEFSISYNQMVKKTSLALIIFSFFATGQTHLFGARDSYGLFPVYNNYFGRDPRSIPQRNLERQKLRAPLRDRQPDGRDRGERNEITLNPRQRRTRGQFELIKQLDNNSQCQNKEQEEQSNRKSSHNIKGIPTSPTPAPTAPPLNPVTLVNLAQAANGVSNGNKEPVNGNLQSKTNNVGTQGQSTPSVQVTSNSNAIDQAKSTNVGNIATENPAGPNGILIVNSTPTPTPATQEIQKEKTISSNNTSSGNNGNGNNGNGNNGNDGHSGKTQILSKSDNGSIQTSTVVINDLTGNNKIKGNDNRIKGADNLVLGNQNALLGANNAIKGELNKALGNSNGIIGSANGINGSFNGVVGDLNHVQGNSNGVFGHENNVQGNANGVWGKKNLVIGNGNIVRS